jgi:peptide deformylase
MGCFTRNPGVGYDEFVLDDYMFEKEYQIVNDPRSLGKVCAQVTDLNEGSRIGRLLLRELAKHPNGVGLAANQIGIDASVCVINAGRPLVLINPVVKNAFEKIFPLEACLSFPGEQVTTQRWANIAVKADNHKDILLFDKRNLLECVCVQHEIDHLAGIIMHERKVVLDKSQDIR